MSTQLSVTYYFAEVPDIPRSPHCQNVSVWPLQTGICNERVSFKTEPFIPFERFLCGLHLSFSLSQYPYYKGSAWKQQKEHCSRLRIMNCINRLKSIKGTNMLIKSSALSHPPKNFLWGFWIDPEFSWQSPRSRRFMENLENGRKLENCWIWFGNPCCAN